MDRGRKSNIPLPSRELGKRMLVVNYDGHWKSYIFPKKHYWTCEDYMSGKIALIPNVDGDELNIIDLVQGMVSRDKDLVGHDMTFFYLKEGILCEVVKEADLLTWWIEGDLQSRGRAQLFLEHNPPLISTPVGQGIKTVKKRTPCLLSSSGVRKKLYQTSSPAKDKIEVSQVEVSQVEVSQVEVSQVSRVEEQSNTVIDLVGSQDVAKSRRKDKGKKKVYDVNSEFVDLIEEELDDMPNLDGIDPNEPESIIEPNLTNESNVTLEPQIPQDPQTEGVPDELDDLPVEDSYLSYNSSSDDDYDPSKDSEQIEEEADVELDENGYRPRTQEFNEFVQQSANIYTNEDSLEHQRPELAKDVLTVGLMWDNIHEARKFLRRYAVDQRFEYKYIKNEEYRLRAKCVNAGSGCPWFFYARKSVKDKGTIVLKQLDNNHTCEHNSNLKNKMADCMFVAQVLEETIRAQKPKNFNPTNIKAAMWKEFTVEISYWTAWRARSIALERIFGNYEDGYKMAPAMCMNLLAANPGSMATCARSDFDHTFKNLCIAFKPFLDGFVKGCRPVIGLDGCFLKGKYGGVCLSATALDGNNGLYPLAIYICKSESFETWYDFLRQLGEHVRVHPKLLTFISDRQKGLIEAVAQLFPNNPHRFCFRHMYKNFKKSYGGQDLMHLAWGAAKAYKREDYQLWADQLKKDNEAAYLWLHRCEVSSWSRAFFDQRTKCEHITNNLSESFNSWIGDLRDLPLSSMIDKFHLMMMSLLYERRKTARQWDPNGIVPRAKRVIDGYQKSISKFRIQGASDHLFNVYEVNTANRWTVNLANLSCSCCVWDLTGIPCIHAVPIIMQTRRPWAEYCSDYHKVSTYLIAYGGFITPMKQSKDWGESMYEVLPPIIVRPAGRPKKQRRRGVDEGPSSQKKPKKCKRCGGVGHNSRTCKGGQSQPQRPPPTLPRGMNGATPSTQQSTTTQPSTSTTQPSTSTANPGCRTFFGRSPTIPMNQVFRPSKLQPRKAGKK